MYEISEDETELSAAKFEVAGAELTTAQIEEAKQERPRATSEPRQAAEAGHPLPRTGIKAPKPTSSARAKAGFEDQDAGLAHILQQAMRSPARRRRHQQGISRLTK